MDGPLGKVHGRAALVRLTIERRPLLDVMRNVGDVDAQPKMAVRQFLYGDRIIEVARVFTVDRHRWKQAEIGAAANVLIGYGGAKADRLRDGLGRVRVGDAV